MRRLLLTVALLLSAPALAWPPPPEEAPAAVASALALGDWQRARLAPTPRAPTAPPSAASPAAARPPPRSPVASTSSVDLILWSLIVACLGALALALGWVLRSPTAASPRVASAATSSPAPLALDTSPMEHAQALAGTGDFAAAIHALLTRTFALLAGRTPLPEALTAREALERVALPPAPHAALAALVSTAEGIRFAGRPASATDFERCAAAFARVRAAAQDR